MRPRSTTWMPSCRKTRNWKSYQPKLAEIERQLASLKQQLEIERRIVPRREGSATAS